MTNFDKIRSMTDEQLTDFLEAVANISELNPGYCDKRCPYQASCESCAVINCEVSDKMIIQDWGLRNKEDIV